MPELVRLQIISRHKSATNYHAFILVDAAASGVDRLAHWWCKCLSGLRTVNPCAHIITSLRILESGYSCRTPAPKLASIFNIEHEEENEEDSESESD